MSIITISQSGQNIFVDPINGGTPTTITINQGQQGPAGVSLYVDNYGDNRLLTSNGDPAGLLAESDLTFDGNKLRVSGIEVALSGHSHSLSDLIGGQSTLITSINSYFATQSYLALTGLTNISNNCNTAYVVVQESGRLTRTVPINQFMTSVSRIDGGGVIYSGCLN